MSCLAYFFVYPAGQTGLAAVTFFTNLPLTQVIVTETVFLMVVVVVGVGAATKTPPLMFAFTGRDAIPLAITRIVEAPLSVVAGTINWKLEG